MKTTHKRNPLGVALVVALAAISTSSFAADITPADARAIVKEAYIYGYPLVDICPALTYCRPIIALMASPGSTS